MVCYHSYCATKMAMFPTFAAGFIPQGFNVLTVQQVVISLTFEIDGHVAQCLLYCLHKHQQCFLPLK